MYSSARKLACFPADVAFALLFWTVFFATLAIAALTILAFMIVSIPVTLWLWTRFTDAKCEKILFEAEKDAVRSFHADITCIKNATFERHGGVNVRYLQFDHENEAEVQTIVLLHGEGMSSIDMVPLAQILSKKHNLYVVDLPGFGRSNAPKKSLFSGDHVRGIIHYIDTFCESKRLSKFVLVGHSFGAFVALSYADFFKEKVSRLVLIDPLGIFPGVGTLGAYWAVFYKFKLVYFPAILGRWGRIYAYYLLDDVREWYMLSQPSSYAQDILASMLKVGFMGGYWKDTKSHVLSITSIPTSVIYGRYDMIVGVHQGRAIHDMFKMDLLVVDDAGHVPFADPDKAVEVAQFIHDMASSQEERGFSVASAKLNQSVFQTTFNPISLKFQTSDMYSKTLSSS